MRNNLILIALVVGALALYVIWETLTARIVAVESATGSYIHGETALPGEFAPGALPVPVPAEPSIDIEALDARLDALEAMIGANAEALDAVLQRLVEIEDTHNGLHNSVSANVRAIESVLQRLDRIENADTRTVSRVRFRESIFFAHDDSTLAPEAMAKIDRVLKGIDDDAIVSLRGHTDTTGDNRHNYYLSIRRAAAVKRYMEQRLRAEGRIDAVLITIDGTGEEGVVNVTEDGVEEPANRIVEILVFDRAARQ